MGGGGVHPTRPPGTDTVAKTTASVFSGGHGEGALELLLSLRNSSQIVSSPPRDPPFPVAQGQPSSYTLTLSQRIPPRALTSPEFLGLGSAESSILKTMRPKLPSYTSEKTGP